MGSISNLKPSAIFRVSHVRKVDSGNNINCLSLKEEIPSKYIAKIGISVEPAELVEQQALDLQSKSLNNPSVSAEFGKKMLLNFFEYVSSFAIQSSDIADKASNSYVPFSALENWYRNFERKLTLNPNFWKSP